jgi:hypothetical protein
MHGVDSVDSVARWPTGQRHRAKLTSVHPETRLKFVMETARAVLDERLDPDQAATAVVLQAMQITPHLRDDRVSLTQRECDSVATRLRMLAEQVNDRGSGLEDPSAYVAIAESIGVMAQALR